MSIRRAAFNSTLATVAKLGGALVAIKVIAYSLGPEGMGQIGQFMSVLAILSVLTSGGISVGVTRYVAEEYNRSD
jgi:polysaccharide transporter, PST family